MKFVVAGARPEFDWPVDVIVPKDGGKFETQTFTGRFRVVPRTVIDGHLSKAAQVNQQRAAAIAAAMRSNEPLEPIAEYDADQEIMREYFIGWGADMIDENDKSVPFTSGMREAVLDVQYIRRAVSNAYNDAMAGGAKGKN